MESGAVTELRLSRSGDEAALRRLWEAVFGPEEAFIDLFFRKLYTPGSAALAEVGGEIVSAAHVVPFGQARYVYAVGTLPEYRRKGLGRAVTLLAAGEEPAYLYPAGDRLREWYIRETGAKPVNFRPVFDTPADLSPIASEEYVVRRGALLKGVPHAEYPPAVTELFALYGEFYADRKGGIWAMEDGAIREALPCRFSDEPYLLGLNGAEPIYWGLTLI
jgi:GNAT superfamily N-acetyltransferase